uniref:Uncharacterized protein n=1 Tax=Romanomermis culicivorax TaxID=13658 RepID=A0A915IYV4_ROMCU
MELSQEVQWLKRQLTEHVHQTNVTEPIKFNESLSLDSTMKGRHKLPDELGLDATSLLLMQEKQHEEEMLKMKMKLTKEIQEAKLLAHTEKIQMDKENKALQDRLREIQLLYESKQNQYATKATENDEIPFAKDHPAKTRSHSKLLDDDLAALHASMNSQNFADLIGGSDQQEKQNDQEKSGISQPTTIRPAFSATKRGSLAAMSPTRRRNSFEPKQRYSIGVDHLNSNNQDLDHDENKLIGGVSSSCKRKDPLIENPMMSKVTSRIISSRGRGTTKLFPSFVRSGSIDHIENILPESLLHNIGHSLMVENVRNPDSLLTSKMMTENSTFLTAVGDKNTTKPNIRKA